MLILLKSHWRSNCREHQKKTWILLLLEVEREQLMYPSTSLQGHFRCCKKSRLASSCSFRRPPCQSCVIWMSSMRMPWTPCRVHAPTTAYLGTHNVSSPDVTSWQIFQQLTALANIAVRWDLPRRFSPSGSFLSYKKGSKELLMCCVCCYSESK